MLIPDDLDEIQLLAQRYEASRYDARHLGMTIVTSLGCNFDCPYCYESKEPSIIDQEVKLLILRVLEDQLTRIATFGVTWFGGEPLIGKQSLLDLSDAFIARCDSAGVNYHASIVTNGSLLDRHTALQLRERRVKSVQVTIDGPPDVHDRMRPYVSGRGSFWQILNNLHHTVDNFDVSVRMNVDKTNISRADELLQILAAEGLAGKLSVYPAQITGIDTAGVKAPSASYNARNCCFTQREFAAAELEFSELAERYGFARHSMPRPVSTPCTAVRANSIVVGSRGELYKCWESVGNHLEVVGDIRDYANPNGRLHKWLKYSPFENDECRDCIALPVCMGGCASHAMDSLQYENRCGTFRRNYREEALAYIRAQGKHGETSERPLSG